MKKPKKTSNYTSILEYQAKSGKSWKEVYEEIDFIFMQPQAALVERLAKELIDWSKLDDSLRISDFHWDRSITPKQFYRLINEHECLAFANELAKNSIASRREKGMLNKSMPENAVLKTQYKWDPMYEQVRKDDIDAKIAISKAIAEAESNKMYIYEKKELPELRYVSDAQKCIEVKDDTVD